MAPDPLVGQLLDGRYQIVARIGEGGMGRVYRARRVHIGDEVALKVLRPEAVAGKTALDRFRQEARATAMLRHPNIVTIHDFGESGNEGVPAFIVMELVEGEPLRELLQRTGRLAPRRAVALMCGICAGVGAAHRLEIVHRDLKPDNVIVVAAADGEGRPETAKVVDFGVAKLCPTAAGFTLTEAGAIIGTPYYMSPEQCRGEPSDARSDVYSLGAMLYEALAGAPPFTAETPAGVLVKHVTETPPSLPVELGVPGALQVVMLRALAKKPESRQADAAALAGELRSVFGPLILPHPDAPTVPGDSDFGVPRTREAKPSTHLPPTEAAVAVPGEESQPSQITILSRQKPAGPATAPPLAGTTPQTRPRSLLWRAAWMLVFLFAVTAGAWLGWDQLRDTVAVLWSRGEERETSAQSAPASVEAMRYWLEVLGDDTSKGDGRRQAGATMTLRAGQRFRLHFTPRESGYLYIIGHGEGNAPTAFLTAQTESEWHRIARRPNWVAGGDDFSFPAGRKYFTVDKNQGTDFLIIYSPTPLISPAALARQSNFELQPAELKELEEFRALPSIPAPALILNDADGNQPFVSVALPTSPSVQPLLFDIRIRHK